MKTCFSLIVAALLASQTVQAQTTDFGTIDGIMESLYAVISGPAGDRDWDKFHSLFHETASMGAMREMPDGSLQFAHLTPEKYIASNGDFFKQNGFWEEELGRQEHIYGELAHIFSGYQFRIGSEDAEISTRGINSIQMIYEDGRWWILSIFWNAERSDLPLPRKMAKKK